MKSTAPSRGWADRAKLPTMPPLFTRFVQSLEGAPDEELALSVWQRLREILEHELKRRSLWLSPPSYLGICGWPNWTGVPGEPVAATALEELVAECYTFIFVDRLGRLQAQLKAKPNIEGLVILNVRHFFLERQKEYDPLGYRVFEMLHAAVLEALGHGELYVLAGEPQIRNATLLGFSPVAPVGEPPLLLGPKIARWNDVLLPGLVLARGKRQEEVWLQLRLLLRELERDGLASFRFRDILDPLKSDTRRRWAALLEDTEEGGAKAVGSPVLESRSVAPETGVESRQSLEKLTRYVASALRGPSLDERTRDYLAALWRYLRLTAGADPETGGAGRLAADLEIEDTLSHRRIAQLLGIPRERLPRLFATLRQWAQEAEAQARSGRMDGASSSFDARRPSSPRRVERPPSPPSRLEPLARPERREVS